MFIAISLTGSAFALSDTTDNPQNVTAHYGSGGHSKPATVASP
jgi:hypothetical protein